MLCRHRARGYSDCGHNDSVQCGGANIYALLSEHGIAIMRIGLALASSALLAACAATTPRIEPARLNSVEKGKTTAAEVQRQFGTPSLLSKNPDGSQSATYIHGDPRSGGSSVVSLVAPGSRDSVTFYFDARGVLTDVKTTQATARNTVASGGASGTATQARPAASPGQTPSSRAEPAAAGAASTDESRTWWLPAWLPPSTTQNR